MPLLTCHESELGVSRNRIEEPLSTSLIGIFVHNLCPQGVKPVLQLYDLLTASLLIA